LARTYAVKVLHSRVGLGQTGIQTLDDEKELYNTGPREDGNYKPPQYCELSPFLRNLFSYNKKLTVSF
jgi:hypothetical protein